MEQKFIEKFYQNIEKDSDTGCWGWIGSLNSAGNPIIGLGTSKFRDGRPNTYKEYSARRFSLELFNKLLTNTKHVKPFCKNKLCVNPDHLVCGDEFRFWSKVQKLSEADGGCWIWTAYLDKDLYGNFCYINNGKKITVRSNRYAFMLRYGFMPSANSLICHTCDNPKCVNPEHLFMGTNQENMIDRNNKARHSHGEKHPDSKLTEEQVLDIRKLYYEGKKPLEISKLFLISVANVYNIIKRKSWKHLP